MTEKQPIPLNQVRLNRVLERQIRKILGRNAEIDPKYLPLLEVIGQTYDHYDEHRELTQRAVELSNQELKSSNQALRAKQQKLEQTIEILEITRQRLVESEKVAVLSHKLAERNEELRTSEEELRQQAESLKNINHQLQATRYQLIHAEKMSTIGQLIAGIAHEIKNPINFVYAGSSALLELMEDMRFLIQEYENLEQMPTEQYGAQLQKIQEIKDEIEFEELKQDAMMLIQDIRSGAIRTKEVVQSLQHLSRSDNHEIRLVDIAEHLDSTLIILRHKIKDRIRIERNYVESLAIEGYAGQLNQVFLNILDNAVQAIEGEGKITITTHKIADGNITISIRDTGSGISKEVMNRIFEPFFTTKEAGKGTGLGLAISHDIIQKHKGKMEVKSTIGEGTEFILTLPRVLHTQMADDENN